MTACLARRLREVRVVSVEDSRHAESGDGRKGQRIPACGPRPASNCRVVWARAHYFARITYTGPTRRRRAAATGEAWGGEPINAALGATLICAMESVRTLGLSMDVTSRLTLSREQRRRVNSVRVSTSPSAQREALRRSSTLQPMGAPQAQRHLLNTECDKVR